MLRSLFLSLLISALAVPASAWELPICADPAGAPYSSRDLSGFDNRIALVLAEQLGAEARFVWMPDRRGKTARGLLHEGDCDLIMGVLEGQSGTLTSLAYYRTNYVFVSREGGPEPVSLDDAALGELRIGVPGGARRTTPPAVGLTRRGHMGSLVHFGASSTSGETEQRILSALAADEIDLAVLWGPMAGHLAGPELSLRPVRPEIDIPFLPMVAAMSIGVRPHDEALRDAIDDALAARWDEIQGILAEARVPLLPLPRPLMSVAGQ